jgi:hypothetical protein
LIVQWKNLETSKMERHAGHGVFEIAKSGAVKIDSMIVAAVRPGDIVESKPGKVLVNGNVIWSDGCAEIGE